MFENNLIAGVSGQGGGYSIEDSLRFNDNDSAYLSRTPSVAGNRKTWTWSAWVKLGNLSIYRTLFAARLGTSDADSFQIYLTSSDKINIGGTTYGSNGDPLLRDPSGWYHIVVAFDTTQATSANRIKAYINGAQITLVGSFPPLNLNGAINNTQQHNLGFRPTNNDRPFDGYMAEVNFIDGQALTPDDFGQIDATTGEWSPKEYAGTYGTNGFYLNFIDPLELGKDASENLPETVVIIENDMETAIPVFSPSTGITQSIDRSVSGTHSMRVYRVNSSTSLLSGAFTSMDGGELSFYANIAVRPAPVDDTFFLFNNTDPNVNPSFGVNFYREHDGSIHYYRPASAISNERIDTNVSMSLNVWYKFQYLFDSVNTTFTITNVSTGSVLYTATSPHYGAQVDRIALGDADSNWTYYIDDVVAKFPGSWNPVNLAATDQMIDTPTNNFSVLTSLGGTGLTLSEGNLEAYFASSTNEPTGSTIRFSSGKWYFEVVPLIDGDECGIGVTNAVTGDRYTYFGQLARLYTFISGVSSYTSYGATYNTGAIIGVAYDADTGDLEFYKNNVSQGVVSTVLAGQEVSFYVGEHSGTGAVSAVANFGADSSFAGNKTRQGNTDANGIGDFYYTPPTGYLALCTDNLPAPAIEQPETQFNVVTYTGNGTSQAITGVGFQPDWVWVKRTNTTGSHCLVDSVRGADLRLKSDSTNAETNESVVTSFDNDGFTVSIGSGGQTATNASGDNYVAWCWKAGGTAVSNTDGSITSQVSANVDAGFSIVSYTATNNSSNVGHGLSQAPELIIFKSRTSVSSWGVYTTIIDGSYDYLRLNGTDAKSNSVLAAPSSSVMYVNNTEFSGTNVGSNNYIAYAFHSVEGFSKFGSYVGNGSADGPFIYTGFKPAFVMIKASSTTGSWCMFDDARNTYNEVNELLNAEVSDAEYVNVGGLDFLSNGFKQRNTNSNRNSSGTTYIYMAFAEHPFNYATGR